jgi:hypothetical protein
MNSIAPCFVGIDVSKATLDVALVCGTERETFRVAKDAAGHDQFRARQRLLCSVKGVGPVASAAILAEMPELGGIINKQAVIAVLRKLITTLNAILRGGDVTEDVENRRAGTAHG